jgi:hypothetical protein
VTLLSGELVGNRRRHLVWLASCEGVLKNKGVPISIFLLCTV